MMALKLSSRSRARTKSDFVLAPDLWKRAITFSWSLELGRRVSHRSQRSILSHMTFGVVITTSERFSPLLGQGALSAETEFVGQRHTLPVSRMDAS